jgi:uncharacterized repeat protein (TIGR02543 family)
VPEYSWFYSSYDTVYHKLPSNNRVQVAWWQSTLPITLKAKPYNNKVPVITNKNIVAVPSDHSVTLSWTKPSDDRDIRTLTYTVYKAPKQDYFDSVSDVIRNGTPVYTGINIDSAVITDVEPLNTYDFNVIVTDTAGGQACYNSIRAATLADTAAPIITPKSVTRLSYKQAYAAFNTTEAGTYRVLVLDRGVPVPSVNTILASPVSGYADKGENTAEIELIGAGLIPAKDVYIVITDSSNNTSEPALFSVPEFDDKDLQAVQSAIEKLSATNFDLTAEEALLQTAAVNALYHRTANALPEGVSTGTPYLTEYVQATPAESGFVRFKSDITKGVITRTFEGSGKIFKPDITVTSTTPSVSSSPASVTSITPASSAAPVSSAPATSITPASSVAPVSSAPAPLTSEPENTGNPDEPVYYSVYFNLNYETDDGYRTTGLAGTLIEKPSDPVRSGYTFRGWYKDKNCTLPFSFVKDTLDSDIVLYADWVRTVSGGSSSSGIVNPLTYHTVSFVTNTDSAVAPQTVENGSKAKDPGSLTRNDGFSFTGWYADSSLTRKFSFDTLIYTNTTLYAGWTNVIAEIEGKTENPVKPAQSVPAADTLPVNTYVNATGSVNSANVIRDLPAKIYIKNASVISSAAIKKISEAYPNTTLYADTTNEKSDVIGRMYLNTDKLAKTGKSIYLHISVNNLTIKKLFEKYFSNTLTVISTGNTDKLSQSIKYAVKADLSAFSSGKPLFVYSYNRKTNKYTLIKNLKYTVDKNGYFTFTSNYTGDFIITDKKLTKK